MRTECQFLGNEISVRVFDLLFFPHSSIVSPSSPSEELRNPLDVSGQSIYELTLGQNPYPPMG